MAAILASSLPPGLALSRLPTPLLALPELGDALGVELWVKRDDLTGLGLSGNKVRKLDFLLAEAQAQGADTVVTCGGIQSNHCRATAVAARQLGLDVALLLRGHPEGPPDGNLLLDTILGAELHWTDAAGYARRDAAMAGIADALRTRGRRPYVIPEGGSNATGALGLHRGAQELVEQATAAGLRFDSVVCAVGSGGTVAGLAAGGLLREALGATVQGIAVCDDRPTFRARIDAIGVELQDRHGLGIPADAYEILEGHQGRGYALSTGDELRRQVAFARRTGLFLDPVYTGKAWGAVQALAPTGALGRRVLFWHTGGLFGLFGRGAELVAALEQAPQ
ncbi:MAG: D-cysteine desulfhydrase family protein [Alphaproteobacteria bacterium]|nr:D-cysteine desulfhydrase family protein [Alphaproteobacteria bacterium]